VSDTVHGLEQKVPVDVFDKLRETLIDQLVELRYPVRANSQGVVKMRAEDIVDHIMPVIQGYVSAKDSMWLRKIEELKAQPLKATPQSLAERNQE
jgi:hypothetical protein